MDMTPQETFSRPVPDPQALAAARRVLDVYLQMGAGTGPYEDQEIEEPNEEIAKVADYQAALPALASTLAFMFPALTYGNEDVDKDISFDSPVGYLCVSILDPRPDSDPDLYAHDVLPAGSWERAGLEAMDEYHFEFVDKTQSIAQAIQRLLDLGLDYQRDGEGLADGEGCLFADRLRPAIPEQAAGSASPPPPRP